VIESWLVGSCIVGIITGFCGGIFYSDVSGREEGKERAAFYKWLNEVLPDE
jgi:hypothetical protein